MGTPSKEKAEDGSPPKEAPSVDETDPVVGEEMDSSPPPADEAPAGAFTVPDEPEPQGEIFQDLLGSLLREGGVARDSESSSSLTRFLEQLHADESMGTGKGPSTTPPEDAEVRGAERSRRRWAAYQTKLVEEQSFLCSRMDAQSEPWICARALVRLGAEVSTSRGSLLRTAGLCFLQGRYQDAAKAINSATKLGVELSYSELVLFDQTCRIGLQKLKEESAFRRDENAEINDKALNLLDEVLALIDNCLLPLCPLEDCALYSTLKGDFFCFLAEAYGSDEHRANAISAYEEALDYAKETCDPVHATRIRAAISLGDFLDKSEQTLRGYTVVRKAAEDIENELKGGKKYKCSSELKTWLFVLNNLKEQLHVKLSGRKGVLPYAEVVPMKERLTMKITAREGVVPYEAVLMKAAEEEGPEMYTLGNEASGVDDQKERKMQQMKAKENM